MNHIIQASNVLSGYTPHVRTDLSGQIPIKSSQSPPSTDVGTQHMDSVTLKTMKSMAIDPASGTKTDDVLSFGDAEKLFSAFYQTENENLPALIEIIKELQGDNRSSFLSLAAKSGEQSAALYRIMNDFLSSETQDSSNGQIESFLKTALRAGEAALDFIEIVDGLSEKARKEFIDFAGSLTDTALIKFITAAKAQEDNISGLVQQAAQMSQSDQILFFDAAVVAGDSFESFSGQVDLFLSGRAEADNRLLVDFLTAAGQSGGQIDSLISLIKNEDAARIISFSLSLDSRDWDNFLSAAAESSVSKLMETAATLSKDERKNFLQAASQAGGNIGDFVNQTQGMSKNFQGGPSDMLSGYLDAAVKSGTQIGEHVALFKKSDREAQENLLSLIDTLTATDYKNFIPAAIAAEDHLDNLMATTQKLSGSDQSYFLYAAGSDEIDLEQFIKDVNLMTGRSRSEFIRETASSVSGEHRTRHIYMKAHLTPGEFENFLAAASNLKTDATELIHRVETLEGSNRKNFLAAAAAAENETNRFIDYTSRLETDELNQLLSFSGTLNQTDLKKFIPGVMNAGSKLTDFIGMTGRLEGSERGDFLAAAADKNQVGNLMDLVKTLGGENRRSFLRAASGAGNLIGNLIKMANHLLDSERSGFLSAVGENGHDINSLIFETEVDHSYQLTGAAQHYLDDMRRVADQIGVNFDRIVQRTGDNYYQFAPGKNQEINRLVHALADEGASDFTITTRKTQYHLIGTDPGLDFSRVFGAAVHTGQLLGTFIDSFS